jgi:hypothetical protein
MFDILHIDWEFTPYFYPQKCFHSTEFKWWHEDILKVLNKQNWSNTIGQIYSMEKVA